MPPEFLPYGRQTIDDDDIQAVADVLRGAWLTTGPAVPAFEKVLAEAAGTQHAVALSNGTAALHAAMVAAGVGPGDEVLVPTLTFAASANAVLYVGARPVLCDVHPDTLLLDLDDAEAKRTPATKAIVTVDFAGQAVDADAVRSRFPDLVYISDGCHALGASLHGQPVGSLADLTCFSFHPVKPVTTGEGGAVTTDNEAMAARMRRFRNHGLDSDHRQRQASKTVFYDMIDLGYNYRLTDIQAALGTSQMRHLQHWTEDRNRVARAYDAALADVAGIEPLVQLDDRVHAFHLYVVRVAPESGRSRDDHLAALREAGIGANVHYRPVHLHSHYQRELGTAPGDCPNAEHAGETILTLPIFPGMSEDDVARVVKALHV